METISGYTLTKEETNACLDLTMASVDAIGLEQTKQIVRLINRQLRGVSTD